MVLSAIIGIEGELLFYQRIDYDDGAISEMVLWRFLRRFHHRLMA
jgi:hypothetical protein